MKIIIKTVPEGKQFVIDIDEKASVEETKKQISLKEGSDPSSYSLYWQTTKLEDGQLLSSYGISANFTIKAEIDRVYYGGQWNGRINKDIINELYKLNIQFPEPLLQEQVISTIYNGQKFRKSKALVINDTRKSGKTVLQVVLALQSFVELVEQDNKQQQKVYLLTGQKDNVQKLVELLLPQKYKNEDYNKYFYVGNLQEFTSKMDNDPEFFQKICHLGADDIESIYNQSEDKSKVLNFLGYLSQSLQDNSSMSIPGLNLNQNKFLNSLDPVKLIFTNRFYSQEFYVLLEMLFKQQNIQHINNNQLGPDQSFYQNVFEYGEDTLIQNISKLLKQIQLDNVQKSFSVKLIFDPQEISTQQLEKSIKNELENISLIQNVNKKVKEISICQRGKDRVGNSEKCPVLTINLLNLDILQDKIRYSERSQLIKNILWNRSNDIEKKINKQFCFNVFYSKEQENQNSFNQFLSQLNTEFHWIQPIQEQFIGQNLSNLFDSSEKNKNQNSQFKDLISKGIQQNTFIFQQLQFFQQKSQKDAILNIAGSKDPSSLADALINKALGGGGASNEGTKKDFMEKIENTDAFDGKTKQLLKQRLSGLSSSTEGEKVKNYFEIVFSIPWSTFVEDNLKLNEAENILNSKHYGMQKAKDAILNFLAVQQHIKQQKENEKEKQEEQQQLGKQPPNVICLVGAPGVGKTSLVEVVAECLHRDCLKVALGGVNNVTYLRGHNYTYVGAKPGAIVSAYQRSKSMNPVILLDEIDKISGSQGDSSGGQVASALLEILDPSQNDSFMDHYLDFPVNISSALFICTANDIGTIPGPLRDRMKIISVPSYSKTEKINIANNYVIPKVFQTCKLDTKYIEITDEAIEYMILNYSPQESGIRKLQEMINEIAQKTVNDIIKAQENEIVYEKQIITQKQISEIFGQPYKEYDIQSLVRKHGSVVGLATSAAIGGSVKVFESCMYRGKGQLIITSDVGKILQASIQIGIGWVKSNEDYLLEKFGKSSTKFDKNLNNFMDDKLTLNFNFSPATAIDGPSAGIALFVALLSCLTEIQLSPYVALTGEITLHGMVTAVGGIKQKVSAAIEKNMKAVIMSSQNEKQVMEDLTNEQRSKIKFYFVETVEEVIEKVFFNPDLQKLN